MSPIGNRHAACVSRLTDAIYAPGSAAAHGAGEIGLDDQVFTLSAEMHAGAAPDHAARRGSRRGRAWSPLKLAVDPALAVAGSRPRRTEAPSRASDYEPAPPRRDRKSSVVALSTIQSPASAGGPGRSPRQERPQAAPPPPHRTAAPPVGAATPSPARYPARYRAAGFPLPSDRSCSPTPHLPPRTLESRAGSRPVSVPWRQATGRTSWSTPAPARATSRRARSARLPPPTLAPSTGCRPV